MTKEILPSELSEKIIDWTSKELNNKEALTNGWRVSHYFCHEPFKQFNGFAVLFEREHDQMFGPCLRIRLMTDDVIAKWDANCIETAPGECLIKLPIDDNLVSEELGTIFIYTDKRRPPNPVVKKQITSEYIYDLFIEEVRNQ
jgi:hypothetical protein